MCSNLRTRPQISHFISADYDLVFSCRQNSRGCRCLRRSFKIGAQVTQKQWVTRVTTRPPISCQVCFTGKLPFPPAGTLLAWNTPDSDLRLSSMKRADHRDPDCGVWNGLSGEHIWREILLFGIPILGNNNLTIVALICLLDGTQNT